MKIRKLLFLLLFLILGVLIFIPNNVKAAVGNTFTIDNIAYRIIEENDSNNLVDVSQCNGNETNIIIPETVENQGKVFDVISIGHTYSLGIGYSNSVTSITIPKSISRIENEAFTGFSKLKEFKVSENNEKYSSLEGVLFSKDKTELIYYPQNKDGATYEIPNTVEKICAKAFKGSKLTSIIIPNSMTEIGNSAFEGASSITSITIPDTVKTIGDYAFCGCTSLTSITIPDLVTTIKDNVFYDCISLTNITIPKSVATIGSNAFLNCTKLKEIKVDEENQNYCSVEGVLFSKDKTEIVCYPDNKEGTTYQIPNSVTTIGSNTFNDCKLTRIIIPNSVKTIKSSAFDRCEQLTIISIPESVTTIENYAFAWCNNLKSVIIPESVTSMEDRTFFGLENIPFTIYCNSGSYAEQYAKDYNINYKTTSIYSITTNLTNISGDGELYTSPDMGDYTIILTANKGYKLPKNIIVKIDGIDLSLNEYEYDLKTGNLKIKADKINGNIEIEVIAEKMYRVSFDANGGNFSNENNILIFEDVDNCDFDNLNIPTRRGYKFIGYYTEKTGGTTIEDIMNSEAGINKDITFYAQWEVIPEDTTTENNPENDNNDDNTENTPSDNNGASTEDDNKEDNINTNNGATNNNNNTNTGNTDKPSGNNPQTGDNIFFYIIILLVSSIGIIFTTKIRKK